MPDALPTGTIALVVNGGLMRGMRAHHRMRDAGATLLRAVRTAPLFRLWSVDDRFPGMIRSSAGGAAIDAELYVVPFAGFAAILESEPDGLCIGRVPLEDGTVPLGVLAEPRLVEGMAEITAHGGWRTYVEARGIPQAGA